MKINKYKAKNKNLCDLPKCERLIQLQLSESTITSLEGIEFYARSLKKLGLFYMSKLENIKGIASLDKVEELEIECAKKIKDISEIGKLVLLKKIILSNCGIISTIKFVESMNNLKFLSFIGTEVADRDLSPIIGVEYIAFTNKKFYSHTLKELKELNVVKS